MNAAPAAQPRPAAKTCCRGRVAQRRRSLPLLAVYKSGRVRGRPEREGGPASPPAHRLAARAQVPRARLRARGGGAGGPGRGAAGRVVRVRRRLLLPVQGGGAPAGAACAPLGRGAARCRGAAALGGSAPAPLLACGQCAETRLLSHVACVPPDSPIRVVVNS